MTYWERKAIREQLEKRLAVLRDLSGLTMPSQGWVKTIREALGLSTSQLAKKVGIDQSRISRLENSEKTGELKLSSLQKIADGLNMKFIYGFVSEETLEDIVRNQARRIALKRLETLDSTMRLEQQALSDENKKKALDDMMEKILINPPKDFWEQDDTSF